VSLSFLIYTLITYARATLSVRQAPIMYMQVNENSQLNVKSKDKNKGRCILIDSVVGFVEFANINK